MGVEVDPRVPSGWDVHPKAPSWGEQDKWARDLISHSKRAGLQKALSPTGRLAVPLTFLVQ